MRVANRDRALPFRIALAVALHPRARRTFPRRRARARPRQLGLSTAPFLDDARVPRLRVLPYRGRARRNA